MKHLKALKWYLIIGIISLTLTIIGCCYAFNPTTLLTKIFAVITMLCIGNIMFYIDCKFGFRKDTW